MRYHIADNLYTEAIDEKKVRRLILKLRLKRPVRNLYVVTMPLFDAGIMEIYDYNELLQPFYRKRKQNLEVLGLSSTRDGAKCIVANILEDAYDKLGTPDIRRFFGIGGAG
ncbi:hypothetical protein SAMN02910369_02021 [Lachnospiraceae bacterium NE2001]|nr:hypothetical protein SAMN02910369_02021 [Lachnospiraceae bacterium NE2001]